MTRLTKEREAEIRGWAERDCGSQYPVFYLLAEMDALRDENETLKKCLFQMQEAAKDLVTKNQKLSSRIAKLREALNLFGHVGNDTKCCEDCKLRIEALTRDDEMEKI